VNISVATTCTCSLAYFVKCFVKVLPPVKNSNNNECTLKSSLYYVERSVSVYFIVINCY